MLSAAGIKVLEKKDYRKLEVPISIVGAGVKIFEYLEKKYGKDKIDESFALEIVNKDRKFATDRNLEIDQVIGSYDYEKIKSGLDNRFFDPSVIEGVSILLNTVLSLFRSQPEHSWKVRNFLVDISHLGGGVYSRAYLSKIVSENKFLVMKTTKFGDYINEWAIGSVLTSLRSEIPNFSCVYGAIDCNIPQYYQDVNQTTGEIETKGDNPINPWCTVGFFNMPNTIFYEAINGISLEEFLRTCTFEQWLLKITQIALALYKAQKFSFTHADLHGGNVVIRKVSKPISIKYDFVGTTFYLNDPDGIATIIDYGAAKMVFGGKKIYSGDTVPNLGYVPEDDTDSSIVDIYKLVGYSYTRSMRLGRVVLTDKIREVMRFFFGEEFDKDNIYAKALIENYYTLQFYKQMKGVTTKDFIYFLFHNFSPLITISVNPTGEVLQCGNRCFPDADAYLRSVAATSSNLPLTFYQTDSRLNLYGDKIRAREMNYFPFVFANSSDNSSTAKTIMTSETFVDAVNEIKMLTENLILEETANEITAKELDGEFRKDDKYTFLTMKSIFDYYSTSGIMINLMMEILSIIELLAKMVSFISPKINYVRRTYLPLYYNDFVDKTNIIRRIANDLKSFMETVPRLGTTGSHAELFQTEILPILSVSLFSLRERMKDSSQFIKQINLEDEKLGPANEIENAINNQIYEILNLKTQ